LFNHLLLTGVANHGIIMPQVVWAEENRTALPAFCTSETDRERRPEEHRTPYSSKLWPRCFCCCCCCCR